MPVITNVVLYQGADATIVITMDADGSIAGQTFIGAIRDAENDELAVAPLTCNVSAPGSVSTRGEVSCTVTDTAMDTVAKGVYVWDCWRNDSGNEYPIAHGAATVKVLPSH